MKLQTVYVACDRHGISIFADYPDRVDFGDGPEWTGYPTSLMPAIVSQIKSMEAVKTLVWEDDPVKVEIDLNINVIDDEF